MGALYYGIVKEGVRIPYPPPNRICPICADSIKNPRSTYCSNKCHAQSIYLSYIARWKSGEISGSQNSGRDLSVSEHVRRYLLERANNACEQCGWNQIHPITLKCPLTVHHIDGVGENCTESNLQVLCPNCHSLTENYGALNTGRGRKYESR